MSDIDGASSTIHEAALRMANAAELNAAVTRANIEMQAMMAANEMRARRGEAQAYDEKAFMDLIKTNCIGYNDVILALRNGV